MQQLPTFVPSSTPLRGWVTAQPEGHSVALMNSWQKALQAAPYIPPRSGTRQHSRTADRGLLEKQAKEDGIVTCHE